jgi:hypothetical protein
MNVSPLIQDLKGAAFGRFCYRALCFLGLLCGMMGIVGCSQNKIHTSYFGKGCYTLNTNERDWGSHPLYSSKAGKRKGKIKAKGTLGFEACQDGSSIGYLLFTTKSKNNPSKIQSVYIKSRYYPQKDYVDTLIHCSIDTICENPKHIASGLTKSGKKWNRYQVVVMPQMFYRMMKTYTKVALLNERGDTIYVKIPYQYKNTICKNMLKAIDTTMYR